MTRRAAASAPAGGAPAVTIVARIVRSGDGEPLTVIEGDRFTEVVLARPGPRPPGGAWVRVTGRRADERLVDGELELIHSAAITPAAWSEVALPEAACLVEPARLAAMKQRSRLISFIRGFLEERGFLEVQTPFLHAQAEGCQVHQLWTTGATGRRLYLRTDPEEYLKRFLTAGFEAVYEVAANVRGEQLDRTHLHEFTSVEGYRRCWRFDEALGLVEELVRACLVHVSGAPVARLDGHRHDLSGRVGVAAFDDLVAEHAGLRPSEHPGTEALAAAVTARSGWRGTGTELDRFRRTWLEHLLDDAVLPALTAPVFVVDFPVDLGLSGRERRGVPGACHRGELYLPGGFELAHFYENITEAGELRRRYAGRLEHRIASGLPSVPLDEDLMRSAELGMPPMSGFAIGIDRLLMVALGADQVSAGLLFSREGFEP